MRSGSVSAKGWNDGATTCYDVTSSFPCIVKRYRCTGCPEAARKHEKETDFTVMDVCGQFDPALRERLPVVVGKKLSTCDLLDSITSLAMRGMSISSIHEHCCEVYNSHHCRKHADYLRHARSYSKTTARFFSTREIEPFETRPLCDSPSLEFIRKAIIEDRKRSIATELRYITSLTGKVMKSDHTFWATKFCRENHKELYGSLFGIMNEHAEVLLWCFAKTKSMNELASALNDFKERFSEAGMELPTLWYVDNPKETEKLLKFGVRDSGIFNGFGDELMVMADLFHVIYNIGLKIPEKHPLKWEFLKALSDALTTADKNDIDSWRATMKVKEGVSDDEVTKMMSKGSLRKYLHTVGDEEGRSKSLDSLEKVINLFATKFDPKTNLSVLGSSEVVGAVNRLKELIANDMIGDPKGVTLYFCLDEGAPTRKYYTSRGSSQLESFWKSLEVIFNGPNSSPEWIDLVMTGFAFRYNIDKARLRGKFEAFPTYRMDMISTINSISFELGLEAPYPSWEHPGPGAPMAEFGARLLKKNEAAYEAFRAVLRGEEGGAIARGWASVADSKWLTEGTGVPVSRGPVTSREEEVLYKAMEADYRSGFGSWDDVDFDGMEEAWNRLLVAVYVAGGEDGPRDYLRYKGKDYKVSDLRLKHASDFNNAAKENYGKVNRAISRGGSQEERKEHFKRKGDSKPGPKAGPRARSSKKKAKIDDRSAKSMELSDSLVSPHAAGKASSWATGRVAEGTGNRALASARTVAGACRLCLRPNRHSKDCPAGLLLDNLLEGLTGVKRTQVRRSAATKRKLAALVAAGRPGGGHGAGTGGGGADEKAGGEEEENEGNEGNEEEATAIILLQLGGGALLAAASMESKRRNKTKRKKEAALADTQQKKKKKQEQGMGETDRLILERAKAASLVDYMAHKELFGGFASRKESREVNVRTMPWAAKVLRRVGGGLFWREAQGRCLILSLMPEHEYIIPAKRDEFNRTTRRLLHSALAGIIDAGDERAESIKLSLAEDMNAKREQRGVEGGSSFDPHLELYLLEEEITDARKAINDDGEMRKKENDKKKKKKKMPTSDIAAAQRNIESLENRAQRL
jgi:hypothetical protein